MKFWAIVALIVGAVVAFFKWLGPRPYKHEERRGKRRRPWRIG